MITSMKRYYEEYSDNEGYSSDEYEYEIPACFCGKDAKRRISFTAKNPARPFFNCYKRNWDTQCGFFVWEDELYSDDESSDDESSSLCDSCLEKEPCGYEIAELETDQDEKRVDLPLLELLDQSGDEDECFKFLKLKQKFDEIESARDAWDREKLELLAKLEAVESELRHVKKKAKLANEVEDDQSLPIEKLSNSFVEFEFGEIGKKHELANEANVTTPLFEKLSKSENETFEADWGLLLAKTKLAIGTDDDKQLLFEKLLHSNDKTVESEFGQIGKKSEPVNEAVDMHPLDIVSHSEDEILESDSGQLIAKTKLAIEADGAEPPAMGQIGKTSKLASETNDVSPFEKLSNPDDESVEPEFGQTKKKPKHAKVGLPLEKLSNSKADEAAESKLGQITKKTIHASEAIYMPSFDKLSNSEKVTEGEQINTKVQK